VGTEPPASDPLGTEGALGGSNADMSFCEPVTAGGSGSPAAGVPSSGQPYRIPYAADTSGGSSAADGSDGAAGQQPRTEEQQWKAAAAAEISAARNAAAAAAEPVGADGVGSGVIYCGVPISMPPAPVAAEARALPDTAPGPSAGEGYGIN
jgi:hypothetical protein